MKTVINNEGQKIKVDYITYNDLKEIFQDMSVESVMLTVKGTRQIIPNFLLEKSVA